MHTRPPNRTPRRSGVAIGLFLLAALPAQAPTLEKVATGFGFVEGPAWNPVEQYLLFTDIPNQRILKLDAKDKVTTFLADSGRANGLVFDRHGELFACQGGARRVVRIDEDGRQSALATSFEGKRLNSPNDIALDDAGGFYFTDPRYGNADDVEQPVMGVYYVDDAGAVRRVCATLPRPNGVVLSPDGSGLYVADTDTRQVHFFPILAPGRLGTGKVLFRADPAVDGGGPDGMTVDARGRIYATFRSVVVLTPAGAVERRIPVPEQPSNCTIGGPDGKTLYITARTSLYRMALDVGAAGDFVEPSWIGRRMLRHPRFETRELAADLGVGYGLAIADVDGDRRPDIVLVDRATVVWYRNPDWTRHLIAERLTRHDHVCVAARDIDGDGKAEIAVGAGWNPADTVGSGSVHYLVAPADRTRRWTPVALPHEPTVHRMRWIADGRGGFELAVAPLHGRGNRAGRGAGVRLLTYRRPADPNAPWPTRLIDDHLHMTHNLEPVQWDDDPADELLVCAQEGVFLLDRSDDPDGPWRRTLLAGADEGDSAFRGASELRLARHRGLPGSRLLATIEPFHGNQLVVYAPIQPGSPRRLWRRQVVLDDLVQGHAIACADFNGDGSDELVVGWRGDNRAGSSRGIRLLIPHSARATRTTSYPVDGAGMACEDLRAADLDGDGHPDLVAAGRATRNLRIYFNRTFQ